jgi:hypothetical protein
MPLGPIILSCRPASEAGEKRWKQLGGDNGPYTGSVKGACRRCAEPVWIGPRQAVALSTKKPTPLVMCLPCAIEVGRAQKGATAHLGNPEFME